MDRRTFLAGVAAATGVAVAARAQVDFPPRPALRAYIDMCASHGVTNIISVGGQRRGMSEAEGADNAVAFLNRIKGHLEDKNVTLCTEIMNHKYTDASFGRVDQIFAHPQWGF